MSHAGRKRRLVSGARTSLTEAIDHHLVAVARLTSAAALLPQEGRKEKAVQIRVQKLARRARRLHDSLKRAAENAGA